MIFVVKPAWAFVHGRDILVLRERLQVLEERERQRRKPHSRVKTLPPTFPPPNPSPVLLAHIGQAKEEEGFTFFSGEGGFHTHTHTRSSSPFFFSFFSFWRPVCTCFVALQVAGWASLSNRPSDRAHTPAERPSSIVFF